MKRTGSIRPYAPQFACFSIADKALVDSLFAKYRFDVVVNLAAQAGVRYSIGMLGHGLSTAFSLLYTIYCSLYVNLHTIYRFSLPSNPCPSNQHSDSKTVTAPKLNRFFNR